MSLINIFALGGLGENGKNMYVVEVEEKLFILDCGIKYPTSEMYGVDIIEPDFEYIIENKQRVVGVFLTHGHDDHIGAIPHLLQISNFPIYATNLTLAILKDMLDEQQIKVNSILFNTISEKSVLKFGKVQVSFFNTNHSIPESIGVSINTQDGSIVYTGNYNFDQNGGHIYTTSFEKLVELGKNKVLAVLPESIGCTQNINRGSILEFEHRMTNIFKNSKSRIILSLFSTNLQRIQEICDLALLHNKKIAIIGRKTQRIVNLAINLGYLEIPTENLVNLRYIDEKNQNNQSDLVVLVTGERHEPYFMLQRMARKVDRLVRIENNDTVVILTRPTPGTEKMAARTLDMLYRVTDNVVSIPSDLIISANANREETKTLLNILKPKYVFPVIGEYRHQYSLLDVADCIGYNTENSVILDNGDIATIKDGNYVGITGEVEVGEQLIDGKNIENVNYAVMRDRELLAEAGVLLIIANINPKTKKVVVGPEIVSKGFIYIEENQDIVTRIREIFNNVSEKHFQNKFINWGDYKNDIKQEVNRYIYKQTKSNPIIIPVVISVDL